MTGEELKKRYYAEYHKKNREKNKEYQRKWRASHREHIREYQKAYWERKAMEYNAAHGQEIEHN